MKQTMTEEDIRCQQAAIAVYKEFCEVAASLNGSAVTAVTDGMIFVNQMNLCRDALETFQRKWDHCLPAKYYVAPFTTCYKAQKTFTFDALSMCAVDKLFENTVSAGESDKKWVNTTIRSGIRHFTSPYPQSNVLIIDNGKLTLIDHVLLEFTPYHFEAAPYHPGVRCTVRGFIRKSHYKEFTPNLYQSKEK